MFKITPKSKIYVFLRMAFPEKTFWFIDYNEPTAETTPELLGKPHFRPNKLDKQFNKNLRQMSFGEAKDIIAEKFPYKPEEKYGNIIYHKELVKCNENFFLFPVETAPSICGNCGDNYYLINRWNKVISHMDGAMNCGCDGEKHPVGHLTRLDLFEEYSQRLR